MPDETIHAERLGRGREAALRCGEGGGPAGSVERAFVTGQWALVWIAAGRAELRDAEGRRWRLGPGQAFQRLPGKALDLVRLTDLRTCYLALPAACLQAVQAAGLPGAGEQVLTAGAGRDWRPRFRRCARALRAAPPGRLAGCLAELLALAVDLHLAAQADEGRHGAAVDRACALLAEDPLRPWTPAGLARAVGLGHHTFRKAFARRTGCAPAAYRLRLRLELAQRLLTEERLPVAATAERCGWTDPLQFGAVFRRHVGAPPGRWRSRHR